MTEEVGPEYQRIMRLIRSGIISGTYPVGSPIPSTAKLVAQTGMSLPVVRRAVDQLKAEGILEGHPGKGVYVKAVPAEADRRRADTEALGDQLAEMRSRIDRLEAIIINLCKRLGYPNPLGGAHDAEEEAPVRKRAGRR